jgi:putative DNA modification/repair radical SAM protein
MNVLEKIRILGSAGKYDICASTSSCRKIKTNDRIGNAVSSGICHSFTPDGRCVSLFKVLYTNKCSFDCKYCPNNCPGRKVSFEPEELARVFINLYIGNYVEGLFLSSGICGDADKTSEKLLETIELIRNKYKFRGYIHSKIIPGVNYDLVKRFVDISDRVSINVETSSKTRMEEISSTKNYKTDILRRQAWIRGMVSRKKLPAGQTTQFIVGASDESDLEIMKMMNWEYKNLKLKRCYFSSFAPVNNTPLEKKEKTPLWREHRLYQVDWLIRKYGFEVSEIKDVMEDGFIPNQDPKFLLAKQNLKRPVDINESCFEDLIKVPGIGPITAKRIVRFTNKGRIKRYKELKNMGVVLKRARPFLKVDGKCQTRLGDYI